MHVQDRVVISERAHMLLDMHMKVDALREKETSGRSIGTTKRGIGPAYASKAIRNGLRVCDLRDADIFEEKFTRIIADATARWGDELDVNTTLEVSKYATIAKTILPMMRDTVDLINNAVDNGDRVLVEGANATMLDVDFGTYPFVTSSNPSIGGVITGLGLAPSKYSAVIGVAKAYSTRVGSGPYPTEIFGQLAEDLRERGAEYGTTTGRPRRVGWLDMVALKYAVRINGFSHLNLTKLDVLSDLDEIPIGVSYRITGGAVETASFPADWNSLQARYDILPAGVRVTAQAASCCTLLHCHHHERMVQCWSSTAGKSQRDACWNEPSRAPGLTCFSFVQDMEVDYESLPGWKCDISEVRKWDDLPAQAKKYCQRVEEMTGVHVKWVGVGPGRDAMIEKPKGTS